MMNFFMMEIVLLEQNVNTCGEGARAGEAAVVEARREDIAHAAGTLVGVHLGVVARIVGDGEEVAGLCINAQVRDAPSVQQLLRQCVAQLYILQAEVRTALKEAARVEHIVSALGVRNGAIGVILGPYVAHLGAEL